MKEYSPSKFCCDLASINTLGLENGITGKHKPIDYSKLSCGDEETFDAWSQIYYNDMKRIKRMMEGERNG